MDTRGRCPVCGSALGQADTAGMVGCPCGYRGYLGYLQEYDYLTARRQWLWERIAAGQAPPEKTLADQYGIWPVAPAQPAAPTAAHWGGNPAQLLLIGLGAILLLLAGLVFVAVAWEILGPTGQLASLLTATALFGIAAIWASHRTPRTAEALAVVAFGLATISATAAPPLGAVPAQWGEPRQPYWLVTSALIMVLGIGLGARFALVTWTWLGWMLAPLVLGAGVGMVTLRVGDETADLSASALAFLALAATLLRTAHLPQRLAGAIALLPAAVLTLSLINQDHRAAAALVLAVALLLVGVLPSGVWRPWVAWPLGGLLASMVLSLPPASIAMSVAAALAGGVLVVALLERSPLLAAVAAGTLWTSWLLLRPDDAALVLAIAAVVLFVAALRPRAAPLAWIGALLGEAALVVHGGEPPFAEVPTLVLAGLFLLAGGLQWRAGVRQSVVVAAPAVTMALVPSALLSWADIWSRPSLIRFLIVLVVGMAVLLVGVRWHRAGLVVPAALAVGITATAQILATLDLLPRWVALALVGALLMLAGARLEHLKRRGRDTQVWLESLQ